MIKLFTYIFLIFTTSFSISQQNNTQTDSIIDILQFELKDTTKNKLTIDNLENIITFLSDSDSLFPYATFDSVYHYKYASNKQFSPSEWKKVYKQHNYYAKRLTLAQVNELLNIINSPLNFKWGECGTPYIEGEIVFFSNSKTIAKISYACESGQTYLSPSNILIKQGNFNLNGIKLFTDCLK